MEKLSVLFGLLLSHASFAAPGDRALVLPTAVSGNIPSIADWKKEYVRRVTVAVRKWQLVTLPATLSSEDANCKEPSCLERLANRFGVDVIIGSKVELDAAHPPAYHISVWNYPRDRGVIVRRVERDCSGCSDFRAAELLEELTLEMCGPEKPPAPPTLTPVSPSPSPTSNSVLPPAPTLPEPMRLQVTRNQRIFRGLAISSAVLGAAGLILGFVEWSRYGAYACTPAKGGNCPQRLDTTAGQALGFVGGVSFLAGASVFTYLGWHSKIIVAPQSHGESHALFQLSRDF